MQLRRHVAATAALCLLATAALPAGSQAGHTPDPESVAVAGSLQSELGCPGDWQPECADTDLTFDAEDGVWQGTFDLPAGSYEYKAALDDSWDENYGANATPDGPNIGLSLGASTDVRFYYDHETHWVADDVNSTIATVAGDFQSELGCAGDWQPWCLRSWMQDADGDGVYEFSTDTLPAGAYEFKVALDEDWTTSFPSANVPLSTDPGDTVTFTYDTATDDVGVTVTPFVPPATGAAVVGDFQSELGCPGDWQPDCADTELTNVIGDVFKATFTIPAGTWNYKVALNDTWDVSHPAANVALELATPTDVTFYFDLATTWVGDTVNDRIVTAPGSYQAAIGCPGDWQPDCLLSLLTDPDGDEVYDLTTAAIPPGDYEAKAAIGEAWDESYPAGNVAFTVTDQPVTFSFDSPSNEFTVDTGANGGGTAEPGDELLLRPPVRVDAQENVFYFVMPDRFDNGDASNDAGGDLSGDPLVNGLDPTHKGFYHGGDLAGLNAQLPYLDGLGINAIWLTPQFTNRWVQGEGTPGGTSAGYHGYWQIDYSSIDPHFGTNAEMQQLVTDAHSLGIDVYFDIVANHTGDVITYTEGDNPPYIDKATSPYLDATGAPFDDRDYAGTGTFPALDADVSFPYTPTFPTAADETVKSPSFLNDPNNYHNRGNSTFTGENSLYGDFFGLDDLFTEKPEVQDGLIDVFKDMVTDYDIDGFRIDTVKHVNDEFWENFGPELKAHAGALGKDDFFMFGEVFSFDVPFLSRFSTDLPLDAVLDFGFQGTARNFAGQGGPTDTLTGFYAADDYYTDADSNAYSLPLFLGNHDIGRTGLFMQQDNPGASDAELVARTELAHALMYFGRGMPVVYYGDEQGFTGDGGDQDARQDMMPSQVASYNDDDLIGTNATTADANFDPTHPLYLTLADYGAVIDAHPALTRGAQLHRFSQASAGIYAFSRIERTEKVEYVVALNNSEAAASATFRTDSPSTSFTEIWPGGGPAFTADATGDMTVDIPALAARVYRADGGVAVPPVAPVVTMTAPAAGAEVSDRVEVGADLSLPGFTEVTFAVSVDSAPYAPIGTDDNAPYRVFHDVSQYPAGTTLEFKAIADNMSGNISSDKVAAVVGSEEPPTFGGFDYAVVHYNRPAGDYGDHTTGDFNDFWGLHLWGDAIDPAEVTEWTSPKPFLGEDEFGRFAWIRRGGDGSQVNFIVHQGDAKDTDPDRFFDADANPEIWINEGDATIYLSQADAQGFATIRYHRDDGDYGTPSPDFTTFWGLHLWGDAIDSAEGTDWTSPKPPDGIDDYGAYWEVQLVDSTQPLNFIIHRGDTKDPGPDESFVPFDTPTVWKQSGDAEIYPSRGAAEDIAVIHYHRDDGDYGDPTSPDFNDFWGLHVWEGSVSPTEWPDPVRWNDIDVFGPRFEVPVQDGAPQLAYIIHRGDQKDPGPDQFLTFDPWGYEVWQLTGEDPSDPAEPHYVLPIVGTGAAPGDLGEQRAHWVDDDTIVWATAGDPSLDYALCHAPTGGLTLGAAGIDGGTCIDLAPGAPYSAGDGFLHLDGLPTLTVPAGSLADVPSILTGQVAVVAVAGGLRVDATGLQVPGVLDDLYATDVELGVVWDARHPDAAPVGTDGEERDPARLRRRRPGDHVDDVPDGVRPGDRCLVGDRRRRMGPEVLPLRGRGLRTVDRRGRDQPRHRPVLGVAVDELDAEPDRRPHRPGAGPRRLGCRRQTGPRAPRGHLDLRAPRPRLLDLRRDGRRGRARHVRGVHRRRLGRDGAPGAAGRRGPQPCPPAPVVRHRDDQRERSRAGRARPVGTGDVSARLRGTAGSDRRRRRPRRVQLGLRPVPLHDTRRLLLDRPRRAAAHRGVPRDGAVTQRDRAAGRDGCRLQPHQRVRPGRHLGARPDRARLLPPPRRGGQRGHVDVLRQHRDRARDDGQAHDRLGRDLGEGAQGRRLPLRSDGSPHQAEHARPAGGPRRPDARGRRRRRLVDLHLRRGVELRRGRGQRPLRAGDPARDGGHRHRHVLRPAPRRRSWRRSLRRRPVAARQPGLHQRSLVRRERRAERGKRPGRVAAVGRPDPCRPRRKPRELRVRRPQRQLGHRCGRGLQRLTGRLHR